MQNYLYDPMFSHFDTITECNRHMTMAYTVLSITLCSNNMVHANEMLI